MNITIRNLFAFGAKITKLNRRAKRLGLPEITYVAIGERYEEADIFEIELGEPRKVGREKIIVHDLVLNNVEPVKVNGWSFAAVLEPLGERNLILPVHGVEIPERFVTSGCACEHCGKHRNRKNVFVIRNGDEFKQVGRACLRDFVGEDGAETVANQFAFYGEIYYDLDAYCRGERDLWTGGGEKCYDLDYILPIVVSHLNEFEFVSGEKARNIYSLSTKDKIKLELTAPEKKIKVTDADCEEANKIIEFFASIPQEKLVSRRLTHTFDTEGNVTGREWKEEPNQYLWNIHTICAAGYFGEKALGIVCSIPTAHDNQIKGEARQLAQEAIRASSRHEGKVGERIEITGTIIRTFSFDNEFGTTHKIVLNAGGLCYVVSEPKTFNADGAQLDFVDEGHTIKFKGTIKGFSEFDGVKQINLLRPSKATYIPSDRLGSVTANP
jgi:hypothetical protein